MTTEPVIDSAIIEAAPGPSAEVSTDISTPASGAGESTPAALDDIQTGVKEYVSDTATAEKSNDQIENDAAKNSFASGRALNVLGATPNVNQLTVRQESERLAHQEEEEKKRDRDDEMRDIMERLEQISPELAEKYKELNATLHEARQVEKRLAQQEKHLRENVLPSLRKDAMVMVNGRLVIPDGRGGYLQLDANGKSTLDKDGKEKKANLSKDEEKQVRDTYKADAEKQAALVQALYAQKTWENTIDALNTTHQAIKTGEEFGKNTKQIVTQLNNGVQAGVDGAMASIPDVEAATKNLQKVYEAADRTADQTDEDFPPRGQGQPSAVNGNNNTSQAARVEKAAGSPTVACVGSAFNDYDDMPGSDSGIGGRVNGELAFTFDEAAQPQWAEQFKTGISGPAIKVAIA